MAFTDSADTSDQDIDKYLMSKKPAAETSPRLGSPQDKTPKPQRTPADIEKILASMPSMPAMDPKKLKDIPAAPPQQYQSPFQGASGAIMFFATLASLMTRHPAMTAMNSFSAMVNANVKGQKQQMDEARENWKEASEVAIKQNEVELERYRLIQEKYKDDSNAMIAHMMAAASGFNDPIAAAAFKSGNMELGYKLLQDRQTQAGKWQEHLDKIREQDIQQAHYKAMEGGDAVIDDETATYTAERVLAGDKTALQNFGRGRQGSANLAKIQSKVSELAQERNLPPDAIAKAQQNISAYGTGQKVAATQSTKLELIDRNLQAAIPQAEAASAKVPRGSWKPINQLVQNGKVATSDTNYITFAQTNLQIAELWARAMNPQGVMREGDRDMALNILSTANSPETYKQQLQVLRQFVQRERRSVEEFKAGAPPNAEDQNPDLGPTDTAGWSIEKVQ